MRRKSLIVAALAAALSIGATGTVLASFAGPWITGKLAGPRRRLREDGAGLLRPLAAVIAYHQRASRLRRLRQLRLH